MNFEMFPWDVGKEPDFLNEKGWEWYTDKSMTKWAQEKDATRKTKPLRAVCFFAKKGDEITRVLVGENQKVLAEESSLEAMAIKIDILRAVQ